MLSEEEIVKTLREKGLESYSNPSSFDPLGKALYALQITTDEAHCKSITAKTINYILSELWGIYLKEISITRAFAKAKGKTNVHKEHETVYYEIRGPGRLHIKNQSSIEPNEEVERIYDKKSEYDFYSDIKNLVSSVKKSILIVDYYIDEDSFNTYIEKIPREIRGILQIRILMNPRNVHRDGFLKVAKMFRNSNTNFHVRESDYCHDRAMFIDSGSWVFGQSLKDAGKKPTYLIKIKNVERFKNIFEGMWSTSTKII